MAKTDLIQLASGYWPSFALGAAVHLGVFAALSGPPRTAAALSETLACSPDHLEALLDSLCGMQLLCKGMEGYEIHPDQRALLREDSPDCLLDALRFNLDLAGLWMKLPDCVRSGQPALPHQPHLGGDPARTLRFVRGMHSRAGIMARGLLPHLQPAPGSRILDVGGGPGTFSLKLLERDPSLHATVLDLPPVAAAAAELHAGHPALARLTFLPGDYHTADFPSDQDVVLYCGALHQEPMEVLPPLLRRMRAALRPGGELAVVDLMLDPDRCTPVTSALFQLNMMLMRPSSRVYTSAELTGHLTTAGFREVEYHEIANTPYRLVRGRA